MTCKSRRRRLRPGARSDPDTCSDLRRPTARARVRRGAPRPHGNPDSAPTRPRTPPGAAAPTPASFPPRRAPVGTPGPTAWARRGHLTVRIPPPALRGLRGRSGGRAGRGGGGGAGEGEAEAGAAAEAGAGAGNGRADAPAAAPSASSREIASGQPIKSSLEGAERGGRPEARRRGFRPCAERPSRRARSTGWRESQKASSSGQDGRRRRTAVGELRTGMATPRLSPRRRSSVPSVVCVSPEGAGRGRETGAGAPARRAVRSQGLSRPVACPRTGPEEPPSAARRSSPFRRLRRAPRVTRPCPCR